MAARRLTMTSRSKVSDSGGVPAISSSQLFRSEKKSVSDLRYSPTSPSGSKVSNSNVVSVITAAPAWMNDREARQACLAGMIGDWCGISARSGTSRIVANLIYEIDDVKHLDLGPSFKDLRRMIKQVAKKYAK
ncbi:hypothetical protein M0R45_006923 [Rubus argutus]|uniref:Uncharacterized protein n=1 Tax=Rubus argutus TaxID=59490 RepID=A0AAW1YS20_RUBAR